MGAALQAAAAHLVRVGVRVRCRRAPAGRRGTAPPNPNPNPIPIPNPNQVVYQREDEARRLARQAVAEQRQQVRVRAAGEEGDLEEIQGDVAEVWEMQRRSSGDEGEIWRG